MTELCLGVCATLSTASKRRKPLFCRVNWNRLFAQAGFHKRLAISALFAGGLLVAGFHFFALCQLGGARCFFRSGFSCRCFYGGDWCFGWRSGCGGLRHSGCADQGGRQNNSSGEVFEVHGVSFQMRMVNATCVHLKVWDTSCLFRCVSECNVLLGAACGLFLREVARQFSDLLLQCF